MQRPRNSALRRSWGRCAVGRGACDAADAPAKAFSPGPLKVSIPAVLAAGNSRFVQSSSSTCWRAEGGVQSPSSCPTAVGALGSVFLVFVFILCVFFYLLALFPDVLFAMTRTVTC